MTEPERVDRSTPDIGEQNREALEALFPGVLADGVLDATRLGELLDVPVTAPVDGRERYGLTWAGKGEAIRSLSTPSRGALVPDLERSIDFDAAQNVFIEGDNLEVLKLMQKAYNDKIKLIYIDPPYNTGNDFVYNDDFSDGLRGYLEYTGQLDDEGNRVSASTDESGRRHSRWLSMMYPRLVLARNLLTTDGAIAISIDDWELANLLSICREVFGYTNIVNVIPVKSSEASGVKMSHVERRLPKIKEYIVLCARDAEQLRLNPIEVDKGSEGASGLDKYLKYYSKFIVNPEDPIEDWEIRSIKQHLKAEGLEASEEATRSFQSTNADRVVYRTNNRALAELDFDTETAEVTSATGLQYVWWEGKQMLFLRDHLTETLCDLWTDVSTINLNKETLGVEGFKNGQKPLALIDRLLQLMPLGDDDVVLDFFAGSGTTGHAVMARVSEDRAGPKFVLVQLPEPLDPDRKEQKQAAEFCDAIDEERVISSLTRERLLRALTAAGSKGGMHRGLRCFSLSEPLFTDGLVGDGMTSLLSETTLVDEAAPPDALTADVLLKEGVRLDAGWIRAMSGDCAVILADGVAVVPSLHVDESAIDRVLEHGARVLVWLEDAFVGQDALRVNAFTRAKSLGITMKTV